MYRGVADRARSREQAEARRENRNGTEDAPDATEVQEPETADAEPPATNLNQRVRIVFTDDFHDVEVQQVVEQILDPPPAVPGQQPIVYIPNNKFAEVVEYFRVMYGDEWQT